MFNRSGLRPNEICHQPVETNPNAVFFSIITTKGRSPRVVYGATFDECAAAVKKKHEELGIVRPVRDVSALERSRLRSKLQYYEQFRPSVVAYVARELAEPPLWDKETGFNGESVLENSEAGVLYWASGLGDRRELTPHPQKKPRAEATGTVLELMLALFPSQKRAHAYIGRRIDLASVFSHRPDWSEHVAVPSEPWNAEEED